LEHADAVHRSVSIRTAQGAWAEVDLTANLYLEGEKRVVQFNIRDTAPRRQLEESLRRGEEGARHTHRLQAVEEVAGSLAHNFNDLLTTIMGQTALLQQETESAAAAGRGQEIMRAAERAAALTRQLRAFGRRQITIPEPLDMSEVIRDVGQLVRVTVTRGISVEFELPDALGRIHADRGDVEQILLNLAVSAREAMPQGGGIVIRASNVDIDRQFSHEHPSVPPGQYVCLTVADSVGGGDGRRQQGRAFQRFQRQSGDPVEGFGLAALFNLVHRNGGSVLAVSELGRGSTFHVYFPRLDGDHISEHAAKPAGGSETILVVEDDVSVRALACQILGRYGYTAIEASHGEEAVRRARDFQGRIHLMITDVAMPQTNGRELVDRLRSDHPEIRILFVSGHTDAELIEQGTLGDGDSFLAKPYTPQALAMKVREILDNSPAA
jgi:signal transduction histidine kinase/ActR/RegA family two-component response regulator